MNVKMKNIAHSEVLTMKEQISYQGTAGCKGCTLSYRL